MAGKFRPLDNLPSWRKIAIHTWRDAGDPSIYSTVEIEMTEALKYIAAVREKTGVRATPAHLVAKAMALAIQLRPETNAILSGRRICVRDTIDIFLQVAIDGGEDLTGAKITNVDQKSVAEIGVELAEKAARLREHKDRDLQQTQSMLKLLPNRLVGAMLKLIGWVSYDLGLDLSRFGVPYDQFGSAMVSNIGTFGLTSAFAPLVPFARTGLVILVGSVQKRPVVVDDEIVIRPILTLGTTIDHRIIDGFQASVMCKRVIEAIEDPWKHFGEIQPVA